MVIKENIEKKNSSLSINSEPKTKSVTSDNDSLPENTEKDCIYAKKIIIL